MEVMIADREWKHVTILPVTDRHVIDSFLLQVFYTHAVKRGMLQVHSALVDYKGKGILFLGPSGIGKTTQAELWKRYRGADIINGDLNFIQCTDKEYTAWGTPWHGSSSYCKNASVPVRLLVVLRQASENTIRRLSGFEKVSRVADSIFYPRWTEGGMEMCLELQSSAAYMN